MPSQISYLGASVISANAALGWNGQNSEVRVELAEAPGDTFSPGTVGGPTTFTIGSFSFRGILRKYTYDRSPRGFTYSVQISDPRHLLDDYKVITSEYRLTTTGIFNLCNVFGYYENIAYGYSQANSTGMPWTYIRDGIHAICNNPAGAFGGPISYRGFLYSVDLSRLPSLPVYFRVGGNSHGMSILEFIQICCDAASYDYYIKLIGSTITVFTVPRINAYPLGTINTILTSTFPNLVIRSSVGLEERNETTSVFLIGGDVQGLYQATPISDFESSFWGFYPATPDETDVNNLRPIIGSLDGTYRWANFYANNEIIYTYPVKRYNLYVQSPSIASILGSTYYVTNDLELQIILGLGQNKNSFTSWTSYLHRSNIALYSQIALSTTPPNFQPPAANAPIIPNNLVNATIGALGRNAAERLFSLAESSSSRLKAIYDFLAHYARNYYGKKWAIHLPGVSRKTDTDTGKIEYSHEISDGGWVDITDPNDLSELPAEAYHRFQTQDGRFQAFCRFDGTSADIARVNKTNSYQEIGSNDLFSKIHVDRQLYFDASNEAYAVIDTDPVYDYPNSIVGLSGVVGALYVGTGIYIEQFEGIVNASGSNALDSLIRHGTQGSIPLVIHPAPRVPEEFQIPIKSNILTYGPWYAQGAAGNTRYEQDPSLVPWNYGGYTNLALAGNAKAAQGVSQIQVIETGFIEVAGTPLYNIGDTIVTGSPNITNISIDYGQDGYTSTYRFETYVPRPGQLGKYNIDRLRRQNIAVIDNYRKLNARAELGRLADEGVFAAIAGNQAFQAQFHPAVVQESPKNMLISRLVEDSNGHKFHTVAITNMDEVIGLLPTGVTEYRKVAAASIESIISPYSIFDASNTSLPRQKTSGGLSADTDIQSALTISPFKNSSDGFSTKYYTKTEVDGSYKNINDYELSDSPGLSTFPKKSFGLKAPLVLAGWGYDLHSQITPFSEDYLTDNTIAKVGAVDLLWDEYRNVWTSHTMLVGLTDDECGPATSASGSITGFNYCTVSVYKNTTSAQFKINAYNPTDNTIPAGTVVQIEYNPTSNKFYIIRQPKQIQCIDYSGPPNFDAPAGYMVNNVFEHNLYISDGSLWDKYCPCVEGLASVYPEEGQLYLQGGNDEITSIILYDPPLPPSSGSSGRGIGELWLQGYNIEQINVIEDNSGQLYLQGRNENEDVDNFEEDSDGQLYLQGENSESSSAGGGGGGSCEEAISFELGETITTDVGPLEAKWYKVAVTEAPWTLIGTLNSGISVFVEVFASNVGSCDDLNSQGSQIVSVGNPLTLSGTMPSVNYAFIYVIDAADSSESLQWVFDQ